MARAASAANALKSKQGSGLAEGLGFPRRRRRLSLITQFGISLQRGGRRGKLHTEHRDTPLLYGLVTKRAVVKIYEGDCHRHLIVCAVCEWRSFFSIGQSITTMEGEGHKFTFIAKFERAIKFCKLLQAVSYIIPSLF